MAIPFLFLYPHFIDIIVTVQTAPSELLHIIIEGEAENSLKPVFRLISGIHDRMGRMKKSEKKFQVNFRLLTQNEHRSLIN